MANQQKRYGYMDGELGTPPPCYLSMQARLLSYSPEEGLRIAMPVLDHYLNPAGSMQGGFIMAAFDNVFGPLCILASGTSASAAVDMGLSFHRPIFSGDELVIAAQVQSRGKTIVNMVAQAYNRDNKLVASASTNYILLIKPAE